MKKLSIYDFGRELLGTNDLDPVYVLLHHSRINGEDLRKWLLSYWCFYHVGTASWIVEGGEGYWDRMETAAGSKDYPRSSERRHFRGGQALRSVEYLRERGVEDLFAPLEGGPYTAGLVMAHVQEWRGFGPWIAFKVADMIERLGVCQVDFDLGTVMYDSPTAAAHLLHEQEGGGVPSEKVPEWAIGRLLEALGNYPAPPRGERGIRPQEAETILCKWKSYMGGHYEVGEDVHACRRGLLKFGRCKTAQRLLQAGKRGGLW